MVTNLTMSAYVLPAERHLMIGMIYAPCLYAVENEASSCTSLEPAAAGRPTHEEKEREHSWMSR